MTTKEKLWLDRFLYEIPLLFCDEEELDYAAIMSQFHYLLLKKDKGTYEEFVRYWTILIITAPDAFDADNDKHNKNLVFSKVKESAIKLNRPMEKIELPPGRPELEPADNFRYENWKPILDETYSRTDVDDLKVYRWYTDIDNTLAARSFFGVYCMLLLRAYTREPSTTITELEKIDLHSGKYERVLGNDFSYRVIISRHPPTAYAPDRRISFSLGTATFLRDAFRSQIGTYRKVLRIVLDWNEYHIDRDAECDQERRSFFEQHVKPKLIHYGLSVMNYATGFLVNIETWLELKSACEEAGSEKYSPALTSFDTVREHIDGVRRQDRTFLRLKPHLRGEKCAFWPYSRLFSSQYFESVGDENNLGFLAFCLDFKNYDRDSFVDSYNCSLPNSIYENSTKENTKEMVQLKTKEEIERGWNEGKATYTSQNPPK